MPEGRSRMDKALICHKGRQGLSLDMTKKFYLAEKIISAPILLGTLPICIISPNGME